MLTKEVLFYFSQEIEKRADIIIGRKGGDKDPVVAAGAFVGRKGGGKDFARLLQKHKSLQKTRAAYVKEYPDDFVTLAFKREEAPGGKGFLGFGKGKHYDAKRKNYDDRVRAPRVFLREGEPASHAQSAFYKEVTRGLHDRELNQPWLSKEQRVVYM